jgi:hypothetical protein
MTPHPLSTRRVCPHPAPKAGGTHSPGSEGVGVNILEDARHWIGLLQYDLPTIKSIELGPPTSRAFSFHWTTEAMKYEAPCPLPRPSQLRWSFRQYFGVNMYYVPVRPYALCGKNCLFLSCQNTYPSSWGVFWGGQACFDPFGVKIKVYTGATNLFFSSYLFLFFSSYLF